MTRGPLSRDAIVDAAVALADEGGMAAVTMRAVAGRLGVEAMSLYHHVGDKSGLLAAAAERVWAGVDTSVGAVTWQHGIRVLAGRAHDALLAHAWALEVASAEGGEPRMRVIDALLGELTRSGLSADDVYEGYHLIDALILGYTAQQASYRGGPQGGADVIPADLAHVRDHAAAHALERGPESGFPAGLDLVLEALQRRIPG